MSSLNADRSAKEKKFSQHCRLRICGGGALTTSEARPSARRSYSSELSLRHEFGKQWKGDGDEAADGLGKVDIDS